MKVEFSYLTSATETFLYDLKDSDLKEYIDWCKEEGYDFKNPSRLREYLLDIYGSEPDVDWDVHSRDLCDTTGTLEVLNKCIKLDNEHRRN